MSVDLGKVEDANVGGAFAAGASAGLKMGKKEDPPKPAVKPGPTDFPDDVLKLAPADNFARLTNFSANSVAS